MYQVLDTPLIRAVGRVRAGRPGLFAGPASFGRCVAKTEGGYGCKVALAVTPAGVSSAFGVAPAACAERPIGDALIAADGHDASLAANGEASVSWERHWPDTSGVLVAATPPRPPGAPGRRRPAAGPPASAR